MPKQRGNGELVQGTLEMLILRTLVRGPQHGYAIAVAIESRSEDILRVEEGSLYPALHRMELAGMLTSRVAHVGQQPAREIFTSSRRRAGSNWRSNPQTGTGWESGGHGDESCIMATSGVELWTDGAQGYRRPADRK